MNPKLLSAAALILGIIIGVMINALIATTGVGAPSGHVNAMGHIAIYGGGAAIPLTSRYLGSWVAAPTPYSMFSPGKTYSYSLFGFYKDSDLEAVVTLAGPGDDGVTFGAEISRSTWAKLVINTPAGNFTMQPITIGYTVGEGYLSIEFKP